ncbi:MAG: hypothetical protein IJU38_07020 [Clostridia bacterium]|nr:hypothetical protein [Clostridia bacterium]
MDIILNNKPILLQFTKQGIQGRQGAMGRPGDDAVSWTAAVRMEGELNGTCQIDLYRDGVLCTEETHYAEVYSMANRDSVFLKNDEYSGAIAGSYVFPYTDTQAVFAVIYDDSHKEKVLCANTAEQVRGRSIQVLNAPAVTKTTAEWLAVSATGASNEWPTGDYDNSYLRDGDLVLIPGIVSDQLDGLGIPVRCWLIGEVFFPEEEENPEPESDEDADGGEDEEDEGGDDDEADATIVVSDSLVTIEDGTDMLVKGLTVEIAPVQSGSGDPDAGNIRPISGWTGLNLSHSGADTSDPDVLTISWLTEAGAVYGGTLDVLSGLLTVTDALISSYAGEELPGEWISDRDVYDEETAPTIGAQVVYKLAEPLEYALTEHEMTLLAGENNLWANCGDITLAYGPQSDDEGGGDDSGGGSVTVISKSLIIGPRGSKGNKGDKGEPGATTIAQTKTGSTVTFDDAVDNAPFLQFDIDFPVAQSGSGPAALDNILPFIGYTGTSISRMAGGTADTLPVSWPEAGTICQGTLDALNGTLTVKYALHTVSADDITALEEAGDNGYRCGIVLPEDAFRPESAAEQLDVFCNCAEASEDVLDDTLYLPGQCLLASEAGSAVCMIVVPPEIEDAESAKAYLEGLGAQILYKLAVPVVYQLNPLRLVSRQGANAYSVSSAEITLRYAQDLYSIFATLDSPAFTGTVTAPTPAAGDSSTKAATTAFVQGAIEANGLRYYLNVPLSAVTNAEIARIIDSNITEDTVLVSCTIAGNSAVKWKPEWTSYEGYFVLTGTCYAATTADIILGQKVN